MLPCFYPPANSTWNKNDLLMRHTELVYQFHHQDSPTRFTDAHQKFATTVAPLLHIIIYTSIYDNNVLKHRCSGHSIDTATLACTSAVSCEGTGAILDCDYLLNHECQLCSYHLGHY